jgi:FkbH-like protein
MTLNQALAIVNSRKGKPAAGTYYLACGFEPLHLATLLRGQLLERLAEERSVEVECGVYGDLRGNLEAAARTAADGCAAVVEWSDLDPRLGLRASGSWGREAKADLAGTCAERLTRLEAALGALAARMPVALAPPSLPMAPIGNTIRTQASALELELERQLAEFLARMARVGGVRVVERKRLEAAGACLDARMELIAGFPYTVAFSSQLAAALVDVLCQPAPKKGLITDLDGTLWAGIVGEIGADAISWSQERHTQAHGLYQQMLGHLADCGVLLAVASKNEPAAAEAGLNRKDLFLRAESFFPVCANWGPKSASVGRILEAWNIAADAVVFIDDSAMELDEAGRAHPGMTCLAFPGNDPAAVWRLLGELRDLFGKPVLTEEDGLRQSSIRASAAVREMVVEGGAPEYLHTLAGALAIAWRVDAGDGRPLELINKTNQFNLNGQRIGESEWQRLRERDGAIVAVASYRDKFGPLGKVAVLVGSRAGEKVTVSHWVMSCRAFSRRIEHHMLHQLFRRTEAAEIEFAFAPTAKNQPLREFFRGLGISTESGAVCSISRADFLDRCGALPHEVSNLTE